MTDHTLQVVMQKADPSEIAGAALALIEHGTGKEGRQTLEVVANLIALLSDRRLTPEKKVVSYAACVNALDTLKPIIRQDTTAALLTAGALLMLVAEIEAAQ